MLTASARFNSLESGLDSIKASNSSIKRTIHYYLSFSHIIPDCYRWGKLRWQIEGFFKTVKHQFSLHRFGQKTLLGVYRWLVFSLISYLLAHWVYLQNGYHHDLDWSFNAQNALVLLFPHILLLSLLKQLELLIPWLYERGFEFYLMRCKI